MSTSTAKDSTMSYLVTKAADEDDIQFYSVPDESAAIVIQSAVRKFLVRTYFQLEVAILIHLLMNESNRAVYYFKWENGLN